MYHIFGDIVDISKWNETCSNLGFDKYFLSNKIGELFYQIRDLGVSAGNNQQFKLTYFMKLIIFYWHHINDLDKYQNINGNKKKFVQFWVKSIQRIIKVNNFYKYTLNRK